MPHQASEFKPEEIVEYEQEPPHEIISVADHAHLPVERKALPPSLLNTDRALLDIQARANKISLVRSPCDLDTIRKEKILALARRNNQVTVNTAQAEVDSSRAKAKKILRQLESAGKLKRVGGLFHSFYKPSKT